MTANDDDLRADLNAAYGKDLPGEELAAFNELFRKHEIPAVILPEPEPAMPVEAEEGRPVLE